MAIGILTEFIRHIEHITDIVLKSLLIIIISQPATRSANYFNNNMAVKYYVAVTLYRVIVLWVKMKYLKQ